MVLAAIQKVFLLSFLSLWRSYAYALIAIEFVNKGILMRIEDLSVGNALVGIEPPKDLKTLLQKGTLAQ